MGRYRQGFAFLVFPFVWLAALYLEFEGFFEVKATFSIGMACYLIALWIARTRCAACGRPFVSPFLYTRDAQCRCCRQNEIWHIEPWRLASAALGALCILFVILVGSIAADMRTIIDMASWDPIGVGSDVGESSPKFAVNSIRSKVGGYAAFVRSFADFRSATHS